MNKRILIIGGYGVFGGRLALALAKTDRFDVFVAGRNGGKATAFCQGTRCSALAFDTDSPNLDQILKDQDPDIVIDAAGPFQGYLDNPYRVAHAAIRCGAHYLDLSDDAEFTSGISGLNELAIKANVTVLSGVSSVPALSSTVVAALAEGMTDIHLIESAIMPGNRAPRGESVVRAIVGQVGRELPVWRGRKAETATGWSESKVIALTNPQGQVVARRWASLIGAPDLRLFPDHFNARSVLFRAGLDLKLMHAGLWLLSLPVRFKLIKSLSPLAPVLKRAADVLEPFGSDVGGMVVLVCGECRTGRYENRVWTLIVRDGDGPNIPTVPAQIMCEKLLDGAVNAGARPCMEAFSMQEAETALGKLKTTTSVNSTSAELVFETAMGREFKKLPDMIGDLHTVLDVRRWSGRARIRRGDGFLSRIAGWLAAFPPPGDDVEVTVEMRRTRHGETWARTFGANTFRSHLSAKKTDVENTLYERFGWLKFKIELCIEDNKLRYPVLGGRLLFVPLPRFLLPKSDTCEYVDDEGRACFDVKISLPIAGPVVSYNGWLSPDP